MSLYGKGFSKPHGSNGQRNYDANGNHRSTTTTNSAGVSRTYTPGGRLSTTSGGGRSRTRFHCSGIMSLPVLSALRSVARMSGRGPEGSRR